MCFEQQNVYDIDNERSVHIDVFNQSKSLSTRFKATRV